jgi:hypothetical protein
VLEHAVIEYGGDSGANLWLDNGQAIVRRSVIRNSSRDGIKVFALGRGTMIESSTIVDNADYGVRTASSGFEVLAANNWWGSPSGPLLVSGSNCPSGMGSRITSGVIYRPFITDSGQPPIVAAPTTVYHLSIAPRRWFAPADGVSQLAVDVTLRDGAGLPVPGKVVRLTTTLGSVIDGGITNVDGATLAYVTSGVAGEAQLTASVTLNPCDQVRSDAAQVSFTPPALLAGLPTDAPAPYLNTAITFAIEPVVQGVPNDIRAKVSNPLDQPIVVDVFFGFAQSGIGLAFGPAGQVNGVAIPAKGTVTAAVPWTPLVSGHYCAEVRVAVVGASAQSAGAAQVGGRSQRNLQVFGGSTIPKGTKNAIDKAKRANDAMGDAQYLISLKWGREGIPVALVQDQLFGNILDFIFDVGGSISSALGGQARRTAVAARQRGVR